MDIHEYLGVLRRGLVFIVLGVLIGLLGGAAVQSMESPSYAATSRDLVTNKTNGDLTEWVQASNFTESRIASYVVVATSGLVLQPVIDDLHLDATVDDLARRITVTAPPATFIIEITATANDAAEAQAIANAVSAEFSDVVSNQLETTNGSTLGAGASATPGATAGATPKPSPSTTKLPNGTVVPIAKPIAPVRIVNIEEAALPTAPLPSNSGLILIVGGVLGLAVGLLAASLREAFDTRVRGPKDIAAVAQIPVMGDIPADRAVLTTPLVARTGGGTAIAEAFRSLRAHADHLRARDGRQSFVITSVGHGQGTTTITANLAVAIANTATSIVVVDADLRSSALSRLFGIHDARGLTEVLAGRVTLDAALRSGIAGGVTVLPAGARPSNPGELLATTAMRELLADLRSRFDVVLVDAPPVSVVTDAAVLGSFDSATLLVLAEGTTTRPRLEDALAQLGSAGSTPVGIVLNSVPRRGLRMGRRRAAGDRRGVEEAPLFAPGYVAAPRAAAPAAASKPVAPEPVALPEPVVTPAPAASPVPAPVETPVAVAPASPAALPVAASAPVPEPAPAPVPESAHRPVPKPASESSPRIVASAEKSAKPAPRRASAPAHLASPIPGNELVIVERPAARGGHRRVTAPAGTTPVAAQLDAQQPAMPPTAVGPAAEAAAEKPAVEKPAVEKSAATAPVAENRAPKAAAKTPAVEAAAAKAPAVEAAAVEPAAVAPEPAAVAPEPATASVTPVVTRNLVTEVEHTVGTARELDFAFAALPTATAAEQRAGSFVADIESSKPTAIERPIVIRPDAQRVSRFAPDPTRFSQRMSGAYANAPAPTAGTQGAVPEVKGTVVNTVSIRVQRDVIEAATVPPPIRHILPKPGSTIPPKAVEAPRETAVEPEPQLVEMRPRTGPVPVPPLARESLPERTPETVAMPLVAPPTTRIDDDPTAETRAIPIAGSLLGEIGGLPRVEVRAARPATVTDTVPNPEREARESYEQRARQLERVAHERLMREQQRLAVDIREQLAHDKRELESVLDNRLEDTVLRPLTLPRRRAEDPRFSDPSDDDGATR